MRVRSIPAHPETYTAGRGPYEPRYVVVHNTGGRGLAGGETAEANGRYFAGGNRNASAHYFVDGSGEVVASVPEADTAWHAGNFAFNQLSIGIEVVSDGSPFTEAEIRDLRELVQDVRARWSIPAENVIRHYDCRDFGDRDGVPGSWVDPWKSCPEAYVDHARWHREVWSRVAPDAAAEPAPEVPEPQPAPDAAGPEPEGQRRLSIAPGRYRCTVDHLRVRTGPGLGYPEVAHYDAGMTVELDAWCVEADGWVWGTYEDYGGTRRYIAVGPYTGEPDPERDYLVKA